MKFSILLVGIFRDTAGQRNFRTIGRGYYASTRAFVLVYDVTNMETFRLVEHFSQLIEQVCEKNCKEKFYSKILGWIRYGTTIFSRE